MDNLPVKPEDVQLLNGLRPYLGQKGQALTDKALNIIQLLTSQTSQDSLESMLKVASSLMGKMGGRRNLLKDLGFNSTAVVEKDSVAGASPAFLLFLILILMMPDHK